MMEAIVYVMVSKCAYPKINQPYANSVDPHRMTLIPSSVNNDEYVVIEDQLLDQVSEGLPDSFNSQMIVHSYRFLQMLGTFGRRQAGDVKRYSSSTGPVIRISSVSNRS